jgi:hypothetical protein
VLIVFRVKEKLRSGELTITGDEWPLFLYHDYVFDPEDPWNGLFYSSILVKVCDMFLFVMPSDPGTCLGL